MIWRTAEETTTPSDNLPEFSLALAQPSTTGVRKATSFTRNHQEIKVLCRSYELLFYGFVLLALGTFRATIGIHFIERPRYCESEVSVKRIKNKSESMIPTINISAWLSPTSTLQSRNAVVDQIRSACQAYGFFQLEGHGIPLEMQNEVLECAERFFSLPLEQKQQVSIKKSVGSANRGYEDFQGQRLETKALPDLKEVRL